jgi:hypothetical protein
MELSAINQFLYWKLLFRSMIKNFFLAKSCGLPDTHQVLLGSILDHMKVLRR